MGNPDTDKTIKIPQAKRTWTLEEHDDGSLTLSRASRRDEGMALATSAPASMRHHWLHLLVAHLDRMLGP